MINAWSRTHSPKSSPVGGYPSQPTHALHAGGRFHGEDRTSAKPRRTHGFIVVHHAVESLGRTRDQVVAAALAAVHCIVGAPPLVKGLQLHRHHVRVKGRRTLVFNALRTQLAAVERAEVRRLWLRSCDREHVVQPRVLRERHLAPQARALGGQRAAPRLAHLQHLHEDEAVLARAHDRHDELRRQLGQRRAVRRRLLGRGAPQRTAECGGAARAWRRRRVVGGNTTSADRRDRDLRAADAHAAPIRSDDIYAGGGEYDPRNRHRDVLRRRDPLPQEAARAAVDLRRLRRALRAAATISKTWSVAFEIPPHLTQCACRLASCQTFWVPT